MDTVIDSKLVWSNLKAAFEKTDLPDFKPLAGDPKAFENLQAVETWGRTAKRTFSEQVKENRSEWVAKEVDKVWLERARVTPELKPPFQSKPLLTEARERVDRKIEGGYAGIDTFLKNERQRILNTPRQAQESNEKQQHRGSAHPLKKDTHATLDTTCDAITRIHAQYDHNRRSFIETARAQGVPDPISSFEQARADDVHRIIKTAHKQLHQSFLKHGIDRAPSQTPNRSGPDINS